MAFYLLDAFCGDLFGEVAHDDEAIAGETFGIGAAVGVVFIFECHGAVRLGAVGKVGVAAGDKDEVAVERPVFLDRTGAINPGVKTIIGAERESAVPTVSSLVVEPGTKSCCEFSS